MTEDIDNLNMQNLDTAESGLDKPDHLAELSKAWDAKIAAEEPKAWTPDRANAYIDMLLGITTNEKAELSDLQSQALESASQATDAQANTNRSRLPRLEALRNTINATVGFSHISPGVYSGRLASVDSQK